MKNTKTILEQGARCRRGVTALEFALLAPLFFVLLMGFIEIAVIIVKNILAENAMQVASRNAILNAENASNGNISDLINKNTLHLIDDIQVVNSGCNDSEERNCLCIVAFANATALMNIQTEAATQCPTGDGTLTTAPDALVLYQLRYRHNFFSPLGALLQLIGDKESDFSKGRLDFFTNTIVKNEPF